jgi:hypothetical protein
MLLFFYFILGLQGEIVIEILTEIVMEEGIETGKKKGKRILTDMIIGGLMTTTIGVMKMTNTFEVVRGGFILQSDGGSRFLYNTGFK